MEVGAVKQAFNNEVILLKKKLNQAKIQIIHKLTRKAKTFAEKKCSDALKEKFKRKAQSAVNEVLIIKKIKPKDVAKFALTHTGNLQDHLNKPDVDQGKACARLLQHKSLQDKYKFMRSRFSSIPIEDLFMSREERRKLKKEAREKQKNKKKGKNNTASKVVNAEGNWEVEDVEMSGSVRNNSDKESTDAEEPPSDTGEELAKEDDKDDQLSQNSLNEDECNENVNSDDNISDEKSGSINDGEDDENLNNIGRIVKPLKPAAKAVIHNTDKAKAKEDLKQELKPKPGKKPRERKKQDRNKNLNEKLLSRKFKKESDEAPVQETKIVDSFFITSTGENYMSVVEPRPPDEVKEEHKQGNRKLRRAVMFGHVPKIKPRLNNFASENNRFNKQNGFNKDNSFNNQKRFDNDNRFHNDSRFNNDNRKFIDKRNKFDKSEQIETKPEKLHPSWEAKKKQSGILPFQGKKIVFDES